MATTPLLIPSRRRWLLALLAVLLVIPIGYGVVASGAVRLRQPAATFRTGSANPPFRAADFTLQTRGAQPVTLSSYRGKAVVLFFGYATCFDECPTTMAMLANAKKELTPAEAADVQLMFISVDYLRDTPELADQFAKVFDPTAIGVTGSKESLQAAAEAYNSQFGAPEESEGVRFVEHTNYAIMIDRSGVVRAAALPGMPVADVAADLRTVLQFPAA